MNPLSAIDAISPAWNHTRSLLRPLRWSTLLKIGIIALFTQAGGCNPNFSSMRGHHLPGMPPALGGALLVFALIAGLIALIISLAFFYLNSRLQFVLFEVVLRRDTLIAPIWRRYGRATWYWMGLKLLFFVAAVICLAPILILPVIHLVHAISGLSEDATPTPAGVLHFLITLLPLLLVFIAAAIIAGCFYRLLYSFGLPSMALEGTSIGETCRRVLQLCRVEPGAVLLYIVMSVLLGILIGVVNLLILLLVIAVALIPLGGAGLGLWFGLHHAGVAGYILMGLGFAVLGLLFLAVLFVVSVVLTAYIYCFWQSYALFFLGGRYPLVGQYLGWPAPPPPGYPPPQPTPAM
jgi:hypothetical protein